MESGTSLTCPLNLSKRPALELAVPPETAVVEMPPLLPIRAPGTFYHVEQPGRPKLGSTGSTGGGGSTGSGDSSSTETSPSTKELFSDQVPMLENFLRP